MRFKAGTRRRSMKKVPPRYTTMARIWTIMAITRRTLKMHLVVYNTSQLHHGR
jgi:hypothetical protein